MTDFIRSPFTRVWALLTAVTVLSWWISRESVVEYQINIAVTVSVLLIAAVKSRWIMRYFMEVRHAPFWLKCTADGWLLLLFLLLLGFYFSGLR